MNKNKKKLTADDFFYFSLTIRPSVTDVKGMRFALWLAVGQIIVVPFYMFDHGLKFLPVTDLFRIVYLFCMSISVLSIITLLLFKTKIYELMVYFVSGLVFLNISFLFLLIGYAEFFSNRNEMELFNTLDFSVIAHQKEIWLNGLLLIPLISFILSVIVHIYAIRKGKTNKYYKKAEKYKQNSSDFGKFLPLFFPVTLAGVFFINSMDMSEGYLMVLLFVVSSIIASAGTPTFIAVSYMKYKFPEVYSEKVLKKTEERF